MTKLKSAREDVLVGKTPAAQTNGEACMPPCDQGAHTENQSQSQFMDSHEEAIRELAYQKWEEARCPSGDGFDFWLEAEQTVMDGRSDSKSTDS